MFCSFVFASSRAPPARRPVLVERKALGRTGNQRRRGRSARGALKLRIRKIRTAPAARPRPSLISGGGAEATMIKLLIADVDGTLVTPTKSLTPLTCNAVARLRAAGVDFTITSGRPPRGMKMLVEPLGLTAPVAAFNGGMYVRSDLKTVLMQRTIPPQVARQVVDHMLRAGLDVWVYQGADWFITRPDAPRVERERSNVRFDPTVVPDLHGVLAAPIKIVGVSLDQALVARCEAELGERLGAEACAARSTPFYLDVTHPEANKGMVVRDAARLLHLPLDQIATIGDMPNDVPMLSVAGLGIAMGNATADVQRIARHVSRSNENEGFAYAVDSFILGEPPIARTALGLPPRTRACLLAIDAIVTERARLHAAAWKQLFDFYLRRRARETGVPFVPFDAVRDYSAHIDGRHPLEGVRSFVVSRGVELPERTLRALIEQQGEVMVDVLARERLETYEGSVRYLRAARDAGLHTAVVTTDRHCGEILRSARVGDLFDVVIDGAIAAAQTLAPAPAPDLYLAAARALGVDPEEAIIFEDTPAGVAAGKAGHFGYVVGIDRRGRGDELRSHGADDVVADLAPLLEPVAS
ncbi:MAG TPA: Cof-type HAD-IIB family hydrolase [Polyangia bacterium]|nr:Cof-type HAD-IIB family hydrolase [Polyangia bacterium]